MMMGIKTNM